MKIRDIALSTKFTNKQGEEKTKWYPLGTLFEKDGKAWISSPFIPGGVAQVFEKKEKEQKNEPGQSEGIEL